MRVRDHVVLSAAGAALLRRWTGRGAAGLIAGGVLIDADHYAWFFVRHRQLNPVAAIRFFNEAHPPQHPRHAAAALARRAARRGGRRAPLAAAAAGGPRGWACMSPWTRITRPHAPGAASALERTNTAARHADHGHARSTRTSAQPWLLPSYRGRT